MPPHTKPKPTAYSKELKTVYKAYPAEIEANRPVKNTVPPIPIYLWVSVGTLFNKGVYAPEQNQKKLFIFMVGDLFQKTYQKVGLKLKTSKIK